MPEGKDFLWNFPGIFSESFIIEKIEKKKDFLNFCFKKYL